MATIIITILLVITVGLIVRKMIADKKAGKGCAGCGAGCAGCTTCDSTKK